MSEMIRGGLLWASCVVRVRRYGVGSGWVGGMVDMGGWGEVVSGVVEVARRCVVGGCRACCGVGCCRWRW